MYKNHTCNDDIPLRFFEIKKFSEIDAGRVLLYF